MRQAHFNNTDSTNTQAWQLAQAFPGESILVSASQQSAGRGRMGRTWNSPKGGAWMSLAWPIRHEPSRFAAASLVAAIAVVRAICKAVPECADRIQVKWPNDVLIDGRKVAGILSELHVGDERSTLIVGVGINVDFQLQELGSFLRHPATTLRVATGRSVSVTALIAAVASQLSGLLTAFEAVGLSAILSELRERLAFRGATVRIETGGRELEGLVADVDSCGRLVLNGDYGQTSVDAGELLLLHKDPTRSSSC
jgi:BirA family biotin operon repressor/biotin-[acetyl-CoA-carboxylase] ligase